MPIVGLTDESPSFREIGRLRKGAPKSEGLKDLTWIRADFRPGETEAIARWAQAYPPQPTQVNVRLAFRKLSASWDANWEVYNTVGQLGRADGFRWMYLCDYKTNKVLVKDGIPLIDDPNLPIDENGMPYMPFDRNAIVYSYYSKANKRDEPVYPRMVGRLKALIPELGKLAFMLVITRSIYDVYQLNGQLLGVKMVAENLNMPLPMIPLVLSRRWSTVSCSYDGKKHKSEQCLLNIEIRPDWAEEQFKLLESIKPGMMLPQQSSVLNLPEGVRPQEEDEVEDDFYPSLPGQIALPLGEEAKGADESLFSAAAYGDGTLLDTENPVEIETFKAFSAAYERVPASPVELRDYYRQHQS